jgi:hypothetical protein
MFALRVTTVMACSFRSEYRPRFGVECSRMNGLAGYSRATVLAAIRSPV